MDAIIGILGHWFKNRRYDVIETLNYEGLLEPARSSFVDYEHAARAIAAGIGRLDLTVCGVLWLMVALDAALDRESAAAIRSQGRRDLAKGRLVEQETPAEQPHRPRLVPAAGTL